MSSLRNKQYAAAATSEGGTEYFEFPQRDYICMLQCEHGSYEEDSVGYKIDHRIPKDSYRVRCSLDGERRFEYESECPFVSNGGRVLLSEADYTAKLQSICNDMSGSSSF